MFTSHLSSQTLEVFSAASVDCPECYELFVQKAFQELQSKTPFVWNLTEVKDDYAHMSIRLNTGRRASVLLKRQHSCWRIDLARSAKAWAEIVAVVRKQREVIGDTNRVKEFPDILPGGIANRSANELLLLLAPFPFPEFHVED
jgi:hypothetical protein